MIGDTHEAAAWFHAGAAEIAMKIVSGAFDVDRLKGFEFGEIEWEILHPGEGVAPEQADAPETLRFLVGRAKVVKEPTRGSFIADLDRADHMRLRKLTREKHAEQCPWSRPLTDAEVDGVIEDLGPQSAQAVLEKIVKEGG